jgi:hypothetical protein
MSPADMSRAGAVGDERGDLGGSRGVAGCTLGAAGRRLPDEARSLPASLADGDALILAPFWSVEDEANILITNVTTTS